MRKLIKKIVLEDKVCIVHLLPLHAIAMERYCHRMASVSLSVGLSVTLVDCDHIR